MKTREKIIFLVTLITAINNSVYAQFQQIGGGGTYESPTTVDKIGVGNFGGTAGNVLSALHIDGSALNTTTGEVFRTNSIAVRS